MGRERPDRKKEITGNHQCGDRGQPLHAPPPHAPKQWPSAQFRPANQPSRSPHVAKRSTNCSACGPRPVHRENARPVRGPRRPARSATAAFAGQPAESDPLRGLRQSRRVRQDHSDAKPAGQPAAQQRRPSGVVHKSRPKRSALPLARALVHAWPPCGRMPRATIARLKTSHCLVSAARRRLPAAVRA